MSTSVVTFQNVAGIVPPVADFADAAAKASWERWYPELLCQYYRAVAAVGGVKCDCGGGGYCGGEGVSGAARTYVEAQVGAYVSPGAGGSDCNASTGSSGFAGPPFVRFNSGRACGSVVDGVARSECGIGSFVGSNTDKSGNVGVSGGYGNDDRAAGNVSSVDKVKGKNWKKNFARRLKKKKGKNVVAEGGSVSGGSVVDSSVESKKGELASSFDERRIAENRLATQKAEYQLKKNEYMTRSRVAEQQWETERLTCDQKLQKITEARFGSKPGFAETLVSANISSTSLPSMSQGTLSPDSSISVAEVNKMFKLIADLTAQVAQLTVESKAMKETAVLSAYEQRKLEMENMTFEQIAALRGTEKDIRPDGSPAKYDAIGQEIYSECGRPDFMNQYDYRSSITVSEDGQ